MGLEDRLRVFSAYDPYGAHLVKIASSSIVPTETVTVFSQFAESAEPVRVIYGLETGKVYSDAKEWLQKAPHHQLIILEDDPGVLRSYFEKEESEELLRDPRALLLFFGDLILMRKVVKSCLHVSLDRQGMYILPSPRYGKEKEERYEKIRRHLYLMVDKSSGETEFIWGSPHIQRNHLHNLERRGEAFQGLAFPQAFKNTPAIICGAGSSLTPILETLQKCQNKALIIAGGSAVNILSSHSILPHLVVSVDPTFVQLCKIAHQTAFGVPFVYADRLHHEALNWIEGAKLYISRGETPLPQEPTYWFDKKLGMTQFLPQMGYSASTVSIAYAHYLGCNPIILAGMDLAYTKNVLYAAGMIDHPLLKSMPAYVPLKHQLYTPFNDPDAPKMTLQFAKEREWICKFAKEHTETTFINASSGGMEIPGIPFKPLDCSSFPSRDLKNELQQAFSKYPFPDSTQEIIKKAREEWRDSCIRADQLVKQAIKAADHVLEGKTSSSAGRFSLELYDLKMKEEVVYHHYLHVFEEAYQEVLDANTLYWALRPGLDKKEERYFKDQGSRFKFLQYHLEIFLKVDQEVPHIDRVERSQSPSLSYKEGKLDGVQRFFYPDGTRKRELTFKDGKREGIEKRWSPSGMLLMELSYHNDQPIGTGRLWDETGTLKWEKNFDE